MDDVGNVEFEESFGGGEDGFVDLWVRHVFYNGYSFLICVFFCDKN